MHTPLPIRAILAFLACSALAATEVGWDHVLVDPSPGSNRVLEKAIADIAGHNDGHKDIVIGTGGDVRWYRFPASGNPHDPWTRSTIANVGDCYEHMQTYDMNGDGRPDIVLSAGEVVRWLEHPGGDGSGSWAVHDIAGGIGHEVRLADIDGDGVIDVVTSRTRNVDFGDGGPWSWSIMDWGGVVPGANEDGMALLDIGSGLGAVDIVCASSTGIYWLENPREYGGNARDAGGWIAHRIGANATNGGPALAMMDVNGDGRMDVVMAPNESDQFGYGLIWWEAPPDRRNGIWIMHQIDGSWQDVHWIEVADVDGDGRPDLILTEEEQSHDPIGGPYTFNNDRVAVLYNLGGGGFDTQVLETTGGQNQVAADIDGDGDLDFVSANHGFFGAYNPVELFVNQRITSVGNRQIGDGTGLTGQYWSNQLATFDGGATLTRTDATIDFDWGGGSPDGSISADHFSARWTGQVQAETSETYTFTTTGDDGVRLWVNGQLIIDAWYDQAPTDHSGSIALAAGQQVAIQMDYYENGGGAVAKLGWSTPSIARQIVPQSQLYPAGGGGGGFVIGNGSGLAGQYWSNQLATFDGAATVTRTDATVDFDWGGGSPDGAISTDHFSARWTGQVQAETSETYTFTTTGDDGVRLWVNGQLIIDAWYDQAPTDHSGSIALGAGQQVAIRMDYYENGGGAVAKLGWSTPSIARQIVPQSQLYPANVGGGGGEAPYGGVAAAIPGTIEAENFDEGGEGVAYHDLDASNDGGAYRATAVDVYGDGNASNGAAVGWIGVGEWLQYTVSIASAGTYTLNARVALPGGGGGFHVECDGADVSGALNVPDTGGWGSYTTIAVGAVQLPAGSHVLRVVFDVAGGNGVCNLDRIAFAPTQGAAGGLAGGIGAAAGGYDLTVSGTLDWAAWGGEGAYGDFDHKASGGGAIGDVARIGGGGNYGWWSDGSRTTTWSDGAPTPTSSNHGYVWSNGAVGSGFSFSAPADTTDRVLAIYGGASDATALFTAHLSDGSAADVAESFTGPGSCLVTFTYHAAHAGQSLTVTVIKSGDNAGHTDGSADLKAAWLSNGPSAAPAMPTGVTMRDGGRRASGRALAALTWPAGRADGG